jgi:hypothetical protein
MKKILIFLLLIALTNTGFAYELPAKNQKIVDNIKTKVLKIYKTDPNKAYLLINKIETLLPNYTNKPLLYYSLDFILQYSKDFIKSYELSLKDNTES